MGMHPRVKGNKSTQNNTQVQEKYWNNRPPHPKQKHWVSFSNTTFPPTRLVFQSLLFCPLPRPPMLWWNLWKFHGKIFNQSASICCQPFQPPHGAMVMAYRFKRLPGEGGWGKKIFPTLAESDDLVVSAGFRGVSVNFDPFWGWSNLMQSWVVASTMFF